MEKPSLETFQPKWTKPEKIFEEQKVLVKGVGTE